MISSERKKFIRGVVIKSLTESATDKLPIDIISIIKKNKNCRLIPYSLQMKKFNLSYKEMLELSETDDAYTVYSGKVNRYLIFYNDVDDNILYTNRYRWSLAHELGHIMLEHHKLSQKTKLFRNSLNKYEYKNFEDEVDWFASYILAPHIPIYHKDIDSAYALKRICEISGAASFNRYEDFKLWKKNNNINNLGRYDLKIKEIFYNYIFEYNCKNCKNKFFNETAKFCPICGSKNITKRSIRDNMIYEDGYKLDNSRKTIKCPLCENEELGGNEDVRCKICGAQLINECTNIGEPEYSNFGELLGYENACEQIVDGNARYCSKCGTITTFFRDKLLKDFRKYDGKNPTYKEIDEKKEKEAQESENDIPF